MKLRVAKAHPFAGIPMINMPTVYGFSTGKEMFYCIPVTGERPITLEMSHGCCFFIF